MVLPVDDPRLARLLQQPALWRGRSAAGLATWPTGSTALDAALPGGGWPREGLIEVLTPQPGLGELRLFLPLLARLGQAPAARWALFVSPPFEPCAPGFAARGACLERLLFVSPPEPLWVLEQALLSGACDVAFGWLGAAAFRDLRRLVLATAQGRGLIVLFRPAAFRDDTSPAVLRLLVESAGDDLVLRLLKARGGARSAFRVPLPS